MYTLCLLCMAFVSLVVQHNFCGCRRSFNRSVFSYMANEKEKNKAHTQFLFIRFVVDFV